MTHGLITIARALATLGRRLDDHERYACARRDHPASAPEVETIEGMLYIGLRPATHDAA
jgi:hypothetical protein